MTRRVFDRHEAEQTEKVESVMRPVLYVPDSKPVDELLREMQAERKHVAVVVDEYGGTAGLVTIEDVLEEIVGEITDEYDVAEVEVEHLADGSTRVTLPLPGRRPRRRCRGRRSTTTTWTPSGADGQAPRPGADRRLRGRGRRPALRGRDAAGRRNRIGAVLIQRVEAEHGEQAEESYPAPMPDEPPPCWT